MADKRQYGNQPCLVCWNQMEKGLCSTVKYSCHLEDREAVSRPWLESQYRTDMKTVRLLSSSAYLNAFLPYSSLLLDSRCSQRPCGLDRLG